MAEFGIKELEAAGDALEAAVLSAARTYDSLGLGKCDCAPVGSFVIGNNSVAVQYGEWDSERDLTCSLGRMGFPIDADLHLQRFRDLGGELIEARLVRVATCGPPSWKTAWLSAVEWCDTFFAAMPKMKEEHDEWVSKRIAMFAARDENGIFSACEAVIPLTFVRFQLKHGRLPLDITNRVSGETAATKRWIMELNHVRADTGATPSPSAVECELSKANLKTILDVSDEGLKSRVASGILRAREGRNTRFLIVNTDDLPENWRQLLNTARGRSE